MTRARATLCAGGSDIINLDDLALIETPEPTNTWTPTPHIEVVSSIEQAVQDLGWSFTDSGNPFQVSVTKNQQKMFGITKVSIPDFDDQDYGLAIGFRNSHNKTMAVRIAVGTNVFVCDNMMMNGDVVTRREHTRHIDIVETVHNALAMLPEQADLVQQEMNRLRERPIGSDVVMSTLLQCVEAGALPINNLMNARRHWFDAFEGHANDINHVSTFWGVQQAVTHEWKGLSPMTLPKRSECLTEVMEAVV